MKTSVHERVMSLVRLAVSATANENEAHIAAMLVCRTILRYPTLLSTERLDDLSDACGAEAPAPSGRAGGVTENDPPARSGREWETFKREHRIEVRRAVYPSRCRACGETFGVDEYVLQQVHVGVTHERCADWWKQLDFAAPVPAKDLEDVLF